MKTLRCTYFNCQEAFYFEDHAEGDRIYKELSENFMKYEKFRNDKSDFYEIKTKDCCAIIRFEHLNQISYSFAIPNEKWQEEFIKVRLYEKEMNDKINLARTQE